MMKEKIKSDPLNKIDQSKTKIVGQKGLFYQLSMIIGTALILATILTAWTPGQASRKPNTQQESIVEYKPTNTNVVIQQKDEPIQEIPEVIGLVAGHWKSDSGAVCPDGLKEVDINLNIASLVQKQLVDKGYKVDLLGEFDENLNGYLAIALVSIHADSCNFINNQATGYKVASAMATDSQSERAARLTSCLRQRYGQATGLHVHSTSVTLDMTSYHAFGEINNNTPAAIIETGFMNLDRELLTQYPEKAAQGITDGILCYILDEEITPPTSTPTKIPATIVPTPPSNDNP
jgi:N-acetylmuramoyl-L-alanine amidase